MSINLLCCMLSEAFGSFELFIDLMFSTIFFIVRGYNVSGENVLDGVLSKNWHDVTSPVFKNYFVTTSVFSNN